MISRVPGEQTSAMVALLLLLVCASLASTTGAASSIVRLLNMSEIVVARQQTATILVGNQTQDRDDYRYERPNDLQIDKTRNHMIVKRRVQSPSGQASKLTPEFAAPIGNVTAVLGRDVRLVCTVENLGQHQVAWLKEETKTILSIDTNIIITNYRIFLIPDEEGRKWVLHIKDVQESDRGYYQCQVNTQPTRSTSGYLEVVVPPAIIDSETTQVVEATEGVNVTLQCKAGGHPRPAISWRREDGEPIKLEGQSSSERSPDSIGGLDINDADASGRKLAASLNQVLERESGFAVAKAGNLRAITHLGDIKSDRLQFTQIDRSMAGLYVCTASNGIPSQVSRQIPLYVKFPPKVSISEKSIAVGLGEQLEIDCFIEAFPKPTSYWSERQTPAFRSAGAVRAGGPMPLVGAAKWAASQQQRAVAAAAARRQKGLLRDTPNRLVVERRAADDSSDISEAGEPSEPSEAETLNEDLEPEPPVDRTVETPMGRELKGVTASKSTWANQTRPAGGTAGSTGLTVTVKQTAVNAYTYKLKITIARMRQADFGEYICKSSNPMGSSSARVLVTMAERNPMPSTAASVTGLNRPLSLTGDAAADNPVDYQRDGMSTSNELGSINGHQQFILASKSVSNNHQHHLSPSESRRSNFQMVAKPSRVYDENYLQAIRNRQSSSSSGYIGASTAYGDRSNGAARHVQCNSILISCIMAFQIVYYNVHLTAYWTPKYRCQISIQTRL